MLKHCRDCRQLVQPSKLQKLDGHRWRCVSDCEANPRNSKGKLEQVVLSIDASYDQLIDDCTNLLMDEDRTIPELADILDIKISEALALVCLVGGEWNKKIQKWTLNKLADSLDVDKTVAKLKQDKLDLTKKYKQALVKLEDLEGKQSLIDEISQSTIKITPIVDDGKHTRNEATAIAMASDWHLEETIDSTETHGLNEYNLEIAEARAINYFKNLKKLIKINRQSVDINNLILWLGGDLINNYLRDEDLESNALSPTEALLFAQRLIMSGINSLLEDEDLKQIIVVCNDGNHGRSPQSKIKVATRTNNSLEILLYRNMAMNMNDDRLIWKITETYHNYVECYDKLLRFHHGDAFRYGGGIGGFAVPLNRYLSKVNNVIKADMDFMGHWHTLSFLPNAIINGSLVGSNAYSMQYGFSHERPQQGFILLDKEYGFTVRCPIFV